VHLKAEPHGSAFFMSFFFGEGIPKVIKAGKVTCTPKATPAIGWMIGTRLLEIVSKASQYQVE